MKVYAALLFLLFYGSSLSGQTIRYSEFSKEDSRDISFEILGKLDSNFIVYKNVRWKHMLAVYDNEMKLIENKRIKFIPDKTFNIDFVVYPAFFI